MDHFTAYSSADEGSEDAHEGGQELCLTNLNHEDHEVSTDMAY